MAGAEFLHGQGIRPFPPKCHAALGGALTPKGSFCLTATAPPSGKPIVPLRPPARLRGFLRPFPLTVQPTHRQKHDAPGCGPRPIALRHQCPILPTL